MGGGKKRRGRSSRRWQPMLCALLLGASTVGAPAWGAEATHPSEGDFWESAGLGIGAGFTNLVYIPAKVLYATLGSLVGGLAYVVTIGSTETAMSIWQPSVGGTYVLTPAMLKGEEPLHFSGSQAEERELKEYDAKWPE
jgi:hypothetical protein